MPHPEHKYGHTTLEDFLVLEKYFSEVYFRGSKRFEYPDKTFDRFMLIGKT